LTSEQASDLAVLAGRGEDEQRLRSGRRSFWLGRGAEQQGDGGRLATRPATVSKWRGRFARQGLAGWADAPRSGKPRHYQTTMSGGSSAALDASPPAGYARWNGTLLAKHLGDISKHQIWRVLRSARFRWSGGAVGVSAPIGVRAEGRRPSWRSICSRRRTAWSCRSMKSRTSGLGACPGLVEAAQRKASPVFNHEYKRHGTTTCSPLWKVAPAWSKPAITGAAGASSSCTS